MTMTTAMASIHREVDKSADNKDVATPKDDVALIADEKAHCLS